MRKPSHIKKIQMVKQRRKKEFRNCRYQLKNAADEGSTPIALCSHEVQNCCQMKNVLNLTQNLLRCIKMGNTKTISESDDYHLIYLPLKLPFPNPIKNIFNQFKSLTKQKKSISKDKLAEMVRAIYTSKLGILLFRLNRLETKITKVRVY